MLSAKSLTWQNSLFCLCLSNTLIDFCSSTLELHDTWYLDATFGHIMRVLSRPCHRTLDKKSQKCAARRRDGSWDMSNNIIVLATDTAKKSWALPGSYLHGSTSPILLHHVSWKNVSSYCIYKNPKTYFVNMVAMNFRFCCKILLFPQQPFLMWSACKSIVLAKFATT